MGVSCAEDHVTHCHKCGYEFAKKCSTCDDKQCGKCNDFIAIAPKRNTLEFWYLCNRCYEEEGGVWWVGKVPKYNTLSKMGAMGCVRYVRTGRRRSRLLANC